MQSATNSGLKLKVLEHYKREIIQTYGFQHVLSLTNLENAGLIKLQVAFTVQRYLFGLESVLYLISDS